MAKPIQPQELSGLVTVDQAIARSLFENEFRHLQKGLEEQKSLSQQILIGVVVAFFFTIGVILVETLHFHGSPNNDALLIQQDLDQKMDGFQDKQRQLNNETRIELDSLRGEIHRSEK
jgi:hypothetical protein